MRSYRPVIPMPMKTIASGFVLKFLSCFTFAFCVLNYFISYNTKRILVYQTESAALYEFAY